MGSRVQIHGSVSQTVVVYQTVSADFVIKTPDPVYSDFIKGQAHVGTGKEAADITHTQVRPFLFIIMAVQVWKVLLDKQIGVDVTLKVEGDER